MNLIKQLEFFDPDKYMRPLHIIGTGAIGSTLAENLVRVGFDKFHLYDFDKVAEKNLANQMFDYEDIGLFKIEAVSQHMKAINPELDIVLHPKGFQPNIVGPPLTGMVFLCVDNIDLRKEICQKLRFNTGVDYLFDFRMSLTDAQHYAVHWKNKAQQNQLMKTMDFTHEEATAATPVSACGTTLSVSPTVRCIVAMGIANVINALTYPKRFKNFIWFSPFDEMDERYTW